MPLFTVDEPQPKLNPPIKSWREDMPENHEPQLIPPQLHWLTAQNDIYLEMPRYSTEVVWWLMIFNAILVFGAMVFFSVLSQAIEFYIFGVIAVTVLSFFLFFA